MCKMFALLLLLAGRALAACDPGVTPGPLTAILGLPLQNTGECDWGVRLNNAFVGVDSIVCLNNGTTNCSLMADSDVGGYRVNAGYRCITIQSVTAATDNLYFWAAPFAATALIDVGCHCNGTCSGTLATLQLEDAAGNAIVPDTTLTCQTSSTAVTFHEITDADRVLDLGEGLRLDTTNTPTDTDPYTLCFHYVY